MTAPRRGVSILLTLTVAAIGIALAVLAVARGPSETSRPGVLLRDARGAMWIENSRAGRAIVRGRNLRPGQPVRGSVVIANEGSVAATVALWTRQLRSDGPQSRSFADVLSLRVRARTPRNPRHGPRTLYEGSLAEMPKLGLGEWRAGRTREYTFKVKLADGGVPTSPGAGDNAYQGAKAQLTFVWGSRES